MVPGRQKVPEKRLAFWKEKDEVAGSQALFCPSETQKQNLQNNSFHPTPTGFMGEANQGQQPASPANGGVQTLWGMWGLVRTGGAEPWGGQKCQWCRFLGRNLCAMNHYLKLPQTYLLPSSGERIHEYSLHDWFHHLTLGGRDITTSTHTCRDGSQARKTGQKACLLITANF